jgi:hypothetical protein
MKRLLIGFLALTSVSAFAEYGSFSYECHQVRTTAEEESATTALKALKLTTMGDEFILSDKSIQILNVDVRLLEGGAPMKHYSYGGYFTSQTKEVFLCERNI